MRPGMVPRCGRPAAVVAPVTQSASGSRRVTRSRLGRSVAAALASSWNSRGPRLRRGCAPPGARDARGSRRRAPLRAQAGGPVRLPRRPPDPARRLAERAAVAGHARRALGHCRPATPASTAPRWGSTTSRRRSPWSICSPGRTLASAPATSPERRAESFITVTAIVIDRHGTLAWIGSRSAVGAFPPVDEVRTLTRSGRERLLASGTTIARSSLRLAGETLRWRAGGRQASAAL